MTTRDEDFVHRLFVASTQHTVLFFSSRGKVYQKRYGGCRCAAPQARGKALINMLPLEQGENITSIMALPEDEAGWEALDVMFATTRGTVRRNKLSDFTSVNRAGKIAMKLDPGARGILDVQICTETGTTSCSPRRSASASASRSRTCACSRAAIPWACAASTSPRATA